MYEKIFDIMTDKKTVRKVQNNKKEYIKYIINNVKYKIYHEESCFITTNKHIKLFNFSRASTEDLDIFMKIYSFVQFGVKIYKPYRRRLDDFMVEGITCNAEVYYNTNFRFGFWFDHSTLEIYMSIEAIFEDNKFLGYNYYIYENDKFKYKYNTIKPFLTNLKEYGLIK